MAKILDSSTKKWFLIDILDAEVNILLKYN